MKMYVFGSIERVMEENGLPVPEGHGKEKLGKIVKIVEEHEMPEKVRERLRNLLALR